MFMYSGVHVYILVENKRCRKQSFDANVCVCISLGAHVFRWVQVQGCSLQSLGDNVEVCIYVNSRISMHLCLCMHIRICICMYVPYIHIPYIYVHLQICICVCTYIKTKSIEHVNIPLEFWVEILLVAIQVQSSRLSIQVLRVFCWAIMKQKKKDRDFWARPIRWPRRCGVEGLELS